MAERKVKYVVVEMMNGYVENHAWPYETREEAEVKYYQVLSEAVMSTVEAHTVMLMTDEGILIENAKFYYHPKSAEAATEG